MASVLSRAREHKRVFPQIFSELSKFHQHQELINEPRHVKIEKLWNGGMWILPFPLQNLVELDSVVFLSII